MKSVWGSQFLLGSYRQDLNFQKLDSLMRFRIDLGVKGFRWAVFLFGGRLLMRLLSSGAAWLLLRECSWPVLDLDRQFLWDPGHLKYQLLKLISFSASYLLNQHLISIHLIFTLFHQLNPSNSQFTLLTAKSIFPVLKFTTFKSQFSPLTSQPHPQVFYTAVSPLYLFPTALFPINVSCLSAWNSH